MLGARLPARRRADQDADRLHARARLPAAGRHRHRVRHPPRPDVRAAADRGQGAGRRVAAPRRPVRGALPADRHLLDGHEAAGEAGPGAGRRPPAAAARRADRRAGPGRPQRDAGADRPDRHRVRHLDRGRLAPARRDRADLRSPGGDRRRPAAARRHDHQHDPGQPGPAGRGRRGLRRSCWPSSAGAASSPGRTSGRCWSQLAGDATYDAVRDAVADLGLPLNRLEQRRRRVEELFQDDDRTRHGGRQQHEAAAAGRPAHRAQAETGVIHDIGYRRYTGRRLGRAQIVRALYWHSLRSAFGLGPRRQGQDRPGDRLRGHVPARDRERGRGGQRQRRASCPTTPTCSSCASCS